MVVVPTTHAETMERAIERVRDPFWIVERGGSVEFVEGDAASGPPDSDQVLGYLPPINPEELGDPSFRRDHGLKYAYVSGAMANGIGSVEIAEAMGKAGMLGIFGAAGLPLPRVEAAIGRASRPSPVPRAAASPAPTSPSQYATADPASPDQSSDTPLQSPK